MGPRPFLSTDMDCSRSTIGLAWVRLMFGVCTRCSLLIALQGSRSSSAMFLGLGSG